MHVAARLASAFILGTLAALLCAAAVVRRLPADPRDAMTAAGMLLMLVWPIMIVAAILPARTRTGGMVIGGAALLAVLVGWILP